MMKTETSEDFSGSNNDQIIVKRKRTKRSRPSSSTSSSIAGGASGGDFYNSSVFASSPTTSSAISTEEDEDMANCLILLARGTSPPQQVEEAIKTASFAAAAEEKKFSSRKFTEMAAVTAANGKVGIYVYECKTCSRTFPSFQALGGHRASHKRPKPTAAPPDEEEEGQFSKLLINTTIITPPPSITTQSPNNKSCHSSNDHHHHQQINKAKIHECSICGSEFASGQALGGHMRRHRPAPNSTSTRIGAKIDTDDSSSPKNMLALDLNLPAPPEDDKFHQFPAKQQQQHLVFSAAAMVVDCHY